MAPPNRILRPDDIQGQFDDFARRIAALETAPSLSYSSIKGGALIVKDGNNVQRARLGLLGDGVTYGLEVDDSTGAVILDSVGLQQGFKLLASRVTQWTGGYVQRSAGTAGPPYGIVVLNGTPAGGEIDVGGGNLAFTLTRKQTVRIVGYLSAVTYMTVVAPQLVGEPFYLRVQGQTNSLASGIPTNEATTGNSGTVAPSGSGVEQVLTLNAGTYNVNLWWNSVNAASDQIDVYSAAMFVYLIGG